MMNVPACRQAGIFEVACLFLHHSTFIIPCSTFKLNHEYLKTNNPACPAARQALIVGAGRGCEICGTKYTKDRQRFTKKYFVNL